MRPGESSRHHIHQDAPAVVLDAVRTLIARGGVLTRIEAADYAPRGGIEGGQGVVRPQLDPIAREDGIGRRT